jgi:hypothetical protein
MAMRRIGQAIATLVLVASAALVHASATPAQKCDGAKRVAVAKKLACRVGCTAKAVKKGLPVTDPTVGTCLSVCGTKFSAAFVKAEQKGGCERIGDADDVEADIDTFLATFETTTYLQSCWGDASCGIGETLLVGHFNAVYASTFGQLEVGFIPGGFAMGFGSGSAVADYLPQSGPIGALDTSLSDPTISASGAFGGEVVALRLNVDFSDAGVLGTMALPFGNLTLCNFPNALPLNGVTVRDFLGTVSTLLGGGSTPFNIADLYPITIALNGSFSAGAPSPFAQSHLVNGACVCPSPTTLCNGGCMNLQIDPSNCGTCGHVCLATQVCSAGVCQ